MENIAVIFGGQSVEHDISIITALQVMKALPKEYKLLPLYIRSDGVMVMAENLTDAGVYLNYGKNVKNQHDVCFFTGRPFIGLYKKGKIKRVFKVDMAILCNHGHGGEDGSLQGMLELCHVPYSSPSVPASALCMDKVLTKIVLKENLISTPAYVYFRKCQYEENKDKFLNNIKEGLSFPCIVKPARCGSSVGISICECEDALAEKIEDAFVYDDKVIVEKYIENAREFFCAVVKVADRAVSSRVDEAKTGGLYTFEDKYLKRKENNNKPISSQLTQKVQDMAKNVYALLECDGVVRVDFLQDEKGNLFVNEINTIPGSLAFNLFDTKFEDLLKTLISSAKNRMAAAGKIEYKFNSSAIERFITLSGGEKMQK